jgi:hypothetical protein
MVYSSNYIYHSILTAWNGKPSSECYDQSSYSIRLTCTPKSRLQQDAFMNIGSNTTNVLAPSTQLVTEQYPERWANKILAAISLAVGMLLLYLIVTMST